MMSELLAILSGAGRRYGCGFGRVEAREARRFAPRAEPLERRVTMAGNIVITGVSAVDVHEKPLAAIYAGDEVYIRVDFTTVGLPSNAKYRVRYIFGDVATGTTFYSPYIHDGAGGIFTQAWNEFYGPFPAQAGPHTVTASIDPDQSVPESSYKDNDLAFTLDAVSSPAQLVFLSQVAEPPALVKAGALVGLTVAVEDAYGNVVTNDDGNVTVALATNPGQSRLGGPLTVAAIDGVATFSALTLNKVGVGYTLALARPGLAGATTTPISVVPATATQLAVTQEPNPGITAGGNFGLQVAIEDSYGNVETDDSTTEVTATLASGVGPLLAPAVVTAFHGLATFANLADGKAEAITIALNGGTLAQATSSQVAVSPATASKLVVQGQPSATATVGQPLAIPPVIAEEDRFGNLESGDNSTVVSASPAVGAGPLRGATAVVSGGLARFASLADGKAEALSLLFRSGNLTATTSNGIVVARATPSIAWAPSAIPEGAGLGAAQYDATASNAGVMVPGAFAYSPAPGTVLALGSHQLSLTFTPADPNDYTTSTATATVDVLLATSTTLSVSATSATFKQPITFTAGVSPLKGGATPTGSITFLDGATVLGYSPIDATGHAKLSAASLPYGTPSITARYSGDSAYASSTSAATPLHVRDPVGADVDGDGRADVALFDPITATFYILESGGGFVAQQLGFPTHANVPVSADLDGDGRTDLAVFDQTTATFYALKSGGGFVAQQLGFPTHANIPEAADFDGDGRTDLAVFDQTTATFYILESGGGFVAQQLGFPTHANVPVSADLDGDGRTEPAIFDQTTATFYALESGGFVAHQQLGFPTHANVPVSADLDGDGRTDLAVFDQTTATFYALKSGGGFVAQPFGFPGDANVPVVGDFEGTGKSDLAIYDQTSAIFYVLDADGSVQVMPFGYKKHASIPV